MKPRRYYVWESYERWRQHRDRTECRWFLAGLVLLALLLILLAIVAIRSGMVY